MLLIEAMICSKDVAADGLKAIRRNFVPADNLRQSVANPLLQRIRPLRTGTEMAGTCAEWTSSLVRVT
ncbi:hypothetical protein L1987_20752 [Smallanthus sonchifolius]|uniref:Uncharacterized protein n=1 Tax=Smallanthus sonchifolius TaxID=185202 RepID=A0ACB9IT72_9ASTR|nr:hypothetical protein L1987_20752 [Smallanthus sonchifolius]